MTEINGEKIEDVAHFRYNLYKYNIGDKIKVTYNRSGKIEETTLELTQKAE